jgi:anti-sigma factor RsiW
MAWARTTCRELVDSLGEYLEGELESEVRERVEGHLFECSDCSAYLASLREAIRLVRECYGPEHEPPEAPPDELIAAVLEARSASAAARSNAAARPARGRGST